MRHKLTMFLLDIDLWAIHHNRSLHRILFYEVIRWMICVPRINKIG